MQQGNDVFFKSEISRIRQQNDNALYYILTAEPLHCLFTNCLWNEPDRKPHIVRAIQFSRKSGQLKACHLPKK